MRANQESKIDECGLPITSLDTSGASAYSSHSGRPTKAIGGHPARVPDGKGRVVAIGEGEEAAVIVSGLPAPTGLAVRGGDLFVTDRTRGEILRIASAGTPLAAPEVVVANLSAPEGVVATKTGFVVVEGESGRVLEIGENGQLELIAELAAGTSAPTEAQPPSMIFNGVAVDPSGAAFATGETNRVLYRIDRPR